MSFLRNFYTELTQTASGGGTIHGNVTTDNVVTLIEAQATAQAMVDDAQDAVAAAEELDDDAKNAAQDQLAAANAALAAANEALGNMNQGDIASLQTALADQATAQAAIDDAQDAATQAAIAMREADQAATDAQQRADAAAEEADDDAVNAAQDALIAANADSDIAQDALITANTNKDIAQDALIAANTSLLNTVAALAHPKEPQDERIGALEADVAALQGNTGTGTGTSNDAITSTVLQDAIDQVEAAQLAVDQAQDMAADAEEADDDAKNAAQDALIAANDTLARANTALAAANEAAIAALPTDTVVQALIDAQAAAQQVVDDAQDALAAAEEADDGTVNAAQDALIAANATLAQANATLAAANQTALSTQEQKLDDLTGLVGGSSLAPSSADTFSIASADPDGPIVTLLERNNSTNHVTSERFHVSLDRTQIQNATSVTQGFIPGRTFRFTLNVTNNGGVLETTVFQPQIAVEGEWDTLTYDDAEGSNVGSSITADTVDYLFSAGESGGSQTILERIEALEAVDPTLDSRLTRLEGLRYGPLFIPEQNVPGNLVIDFYAELPNQRFQLQVRNNGASRTGWQAVLSNRQARLVLKVGKV